MIGIILCYLHRKLFYNHAWNYAWEVGEPVLCLLCGETWKGNKTDLPLRIRYLESENIIDRTNNEKTA